MPGQKCPTTEDLRLFAVGDLPEQDFLAVASHLDKCEKCGVDLKTFDESQDPLVDSLRRVPHILPGPDTSTSDGSRVVGSSSQSVDDLLLDPGQNYSRRLLVGPVRVDQFELQSELGSGSFGYVFRARDTELDRQVAIKIQRAGSWASEEELQRFLREAKSAARLKHRSIVSVFETGQTADGIGYMVTEYIEGNTLERELQDGKIPTKLAVTYLAELAEALDYAHRHDVIHRDVKPSNIIIDTGGEIHLMDFGLAKRMAAGDTVTHDGKILGTPAYMSPEQAGGDSHRVDARSDVYSLGVVMYEILTGQKPFQGQQRLLLLQVLEDNPRPPMQLDDQIPKDLEVICLKSLAKLPRHRYQSAGEMAADLRRFQNGQPIVARPIGYAERLRRWCHRYPLAVVAFVALLLCSIAAVIYLSNLSQYFVRQTARDSAQMQSEMLDLINESYADIVKRLDAYLNEKSDAIGIDHIDSRFHDPIDPVVPVPARFTIDLGQRLEPYETGVQVRLYSHYPFPWRKDGGPPDDFARRAITKLESEPTQPVVEFTQYNDRPVVRFASARVMANSCIDCHNRHPESPKRDWQTGDVRGVLEIIRPLERDQLRTQRGLGNAITWIAIISGILISFCFIAFVVTLRKNARPGGPG